MASLRDSVLAASIGRDRVVDAVKGAALLLVVIGHNLAWTSLPGGEVQTTLDAAPQFFWLTWLLQIIPLFFVMAGVGLRRLAGAAPSAYLSRVSRLLTPTLPLVAAAVVIAAIVGAVAPDLAPVAGVLPVQLLWFIGVYLLVIAVAPVLLRVTRGWQFALWLCAIASVDLGRVTVDESFGWLNLLLIWALFAGLGVNLVRLRSLPRWQVMVALAASIAGACLLVWLGPYSRALISTDAVPGISNLAPPTLVLALAGIAQTCALLLVWDPLARLLARDRVWVPVAVFSSRAMELYVYHVLLMALLISGVLALNIAPAALSASWWALHLVVLAIDAGTLLLLAPTLRHLSSRLTAALARGVPASLARMLANGPRSRALVVAAALGITVLLVSEGGVNDLVTPRVVVVLPYVPIVALAFLTVGTAVATRASQRLN